MATLETRRALLSDASVMSRLCLELGYDCTEVVMRRRLTRLKDDPEHGVFVASLDGEQTVGWVHAQVRKTLWSEPFVDILGLVVNVKRRRLGIGRILLDRVEVWADSRDVLDLRVAVHLHREEALAFFPARGFGHTEDRRVFRRVVEDIEVTGHPTLVE